MLSITQIRTSDGIAALTQPILPSGLLSYYRLWTKWLFRPSLAGSPQMAPYCLPIQVCISAWLPRPSMMKPSLTHLLKATPLSFPDPLRLCLLLGLYKAASSAWTALLHLSLPANSCFSLKTYSGCLFLGVFFSTVLGNINLFLLAPFCSNLIISHLIIRFLYTLSLCPTFVDGGLF